MLFSQCDKFGRSESKAFWYEKAGDCKHFGTISSTTLVHVSLNVHAKTAAGVSEDFDKLNTT